MHIAKLAKNQQSELECWERYGKTDEKQRGNARSLSYGGNILESVA